MGSTRPSGLGWTYVMGWVGLNFFWPTMVGWVKKSPQPNLTWPMHTPSRLFVQVNLCPVKLKSVNSNFSKATRKSSMVMVRCIDTFFSLMREVWHWNHRYNTKDPQQETLNEIKVPTTSTFHLPLDIHKTLWNTTQNHPFPLP